MRAGWAFGGWQQGGRAAGWLAAKAWAAPACAPCCWHIQRELQCCAPPRPLLARSTAPFLPHPHTHTEDYHWWWRAYLTSGSSALYLLLYSLFYFYTKLDITKLVPALMYFGACGVGRSGRIAAWVAPAAGDGGAAAAATRVCMCLCSAAPAARTHPVCSFASRSIHARPPHQAT